MTKSKFRSWAFLPPIMTLACTGLLYLIFKGMYTPPLTKPPTAVYVFLGLFLFSWLWLVFGELRRGVVLIKIDGNSLSVTGYMGLGISKNYNLTDFQGISTTKVPTRSGTYEYLYLIKDKRKVVKISEFYHKNYFELKQVLISRTKFLGDKPYNLITELKEVF